MLSRLKLLKRLQEVDLSPDEVWALVDRVKTHTSNPEDHERLARLIRATTAVTDELRAASHDPEPSSAPRRLSPERRAKRKRQLSKAARRRQRR